MVTLPWMLLQSFFFSVSLVAPVQTRRLIPRQCEEGASRVAFAVAVAHARSKSQ